MRDRIGRRDFLAAGAGITGMVLSQGPLSLEVRAAESMRPVSQGKASKLPVVGFMLDGGISQAEFLDAKEMPKSDHDSGVGSVTTNSGLILSKAFELLSPVVEKLTVLRTMRSNADHIAGLNQLLWNNAKDQTLHIDIADRHDQSPYGYVYLESSFMGHGDALSSEPNQVREWFHPFHSVPKALQPKFNGQSYDPIKVESLVPADRMKGRSTLLTTLNGDDFRSTATDRYSAFARNALHLVLGETSAAFEEPPAAKLKQYGDNTFGRAAYIGGRLLNDGAGSVMIRNGHWDMHDNIRRLMLAGGPLLARALTALIDDMESGEVKPGVVWAASEIGRDPTINPTKGRHHWSTTSALLYGGAFKPGVYGKTDNSWQPASKEYPNADFRHLILRAANLEPMDSEKAGLHKELFK